MKNTLNWGIIGPGNIAKQFVRGLERLPDVGMVACASTDKERSERFAAEFPRVQRAYASYDELLHDDEIDVVYISTVNATHFACVVAALHAGKHVLCEKPLGLTSGEVSQMIALAERQQLFFMEAMWTRFLPAYRQVRQWVADGQIGEVRFLTSDFSFLANRPPEHRLFNPELGGGALYDIGVYCVAFATDFLGNRPENIVSAVHRGKTGVDDTVSVVLEYDTGAQAQLFCSFVVNTPSDAVIYGTEGHIVLPSFWNGSSAKLYKNRQEYLAISNAKEGNGYQYEAQEAMNCIRAGKLCSSTMSWEDSLSIARIIEEALQ